MNNPKLSVELVPKTCWFSNVRSSISKADWKRLSENQTKIAKFICEICGNKEEKRSLECHEIWSYDEINFIQKLQGLKSLCPSCHSVKHIGLAKILGKYEEAFQHLCKINNWTKDEAEVYLKETWKIWRFRSEHHWKLDISWLQDKNITILHKNEKT